MPLIEYRGLSNYNEQPLTGVLRLWTTGQRQDVTAAIKTNLIAANVGFQAYSENIDVQESTVATASRNLTGGDIGNVVMCSGSSAIALTIQTDTLMGFSEITTIAAYQGGTGAVTFAAGSGVTLRGTAPTAAQYLVSGIMRVGANEWAYL
jgi:hypothetical protein